MEQLTAFMAVPSLASTSSAAFQTTIGAEYHIDGEFFRQAVGALWCTLTTPGTLGVCLTIVPSAAEPFGAAHSS